MSSAVHQLPTPTARDHKGRTAWAGTVRADGRVRRSGDHALPTVVGLLPTPATQPTTGNGHARDLGSEVALLPTPEAALGDGGHYSRGGVRAGELLLSGIALAFAGDSGAALLPTASATRGGSTTEITAALAPEPVDAAAVGSQSGPYAAAINQ